MTSIFFKEPLNKPSLCGAPVQRCNATPRQINGLTVFSVTQVVVSYLTNTLLKDKISWHKQFIVFSENGRRIMPYFDCFPKHPSASLRTLTYPWTSAPRCSDRSTEPAMAVVIAAHRHQARTENLIPARSEIHRTRLRCALSECAVSVIIASFPDKTRIDAGTVLRRLLVNRFTTLLPHGAGSALR